MDPIGPLQLRVMRFIWDTGPSTVHQVHEAVNRAAGTELAYTTILTVMRNLAKRGVLEQRPAGRSHIFAPNLTEDEYRCAMLHQAAANLFAGDLDRLVAFVRDNQAAIRAIPETLSL